MTKDSSFTIVVGLDGSKDSQAALDWAVDEARQRGGQLHLITAWTKQPMAWYPAVLETAAGGIAVVDSPEEDAATVQAKALKSVADTGVSATGQVIHTHSAASAILQAAQEADLVVIGSRGHGGFPGLRVGSVTTHVVNHAPGAVLVVRPKPAAAQ
ncbi:universal stress protein [Arthrobacter jiangjiafuii]|uniref:Universal stress protein n=1 Tax=Arthrobacter jiangjiafuii TaxID=2817475 RepID=A0A975M667_9MICC|nr:universal stress protein [Arthrobacter jiangjiafuii]MBP3044800.1 universal stress protein [Arthrobacter jiangjiafuii]QWC10374.1 universal stress protein [Arthrobacter jiangjiafuii]